MSELGKVLVVIGCLVAVAGALLWSGAGRGWLGRLPGDFHHSRGNFTFYFPLMTSIVASIVLTVILWLLRKF